MYYPFIRGKQFELVMLREMAPKIAEWGFVPIIEPVKGNFPALKRALDKLIESECRFILITNPQVGELKNDNSTLVDEIVADHLGDYEQYSVGLLLNAEDSLRVAKDFFKTHDLPIAVIHKGFSDGKGLVELIDEKKPDISVHIFVMPHSTSLYRKRFVDSTRILIEDGFISRNNREHPPTEPFSELYLTYPDQGGQGFGDFLIVGSDYKEGGGPAYAIAIHLTYADPKADEALAIKHYVSDQVNSPKDPAGKFFEALSKLVKDVNKSGSPIYKSLAVKEYLQLHKDQHFPGLGYVKKLSMQHHIELMAHLLGKEA